VPGQPAGLTLGRPDVSVGISSMRKELLESRLYRRTAADTVWWENYLTTDRYYKNLGSLFKYVIMPRHHVGQ